MYTLFRGLYKYMFQKDEYFVLIIGLDNAGKTTYLEQTKTQFNANYKAMNPAKITTTVGLNIGKVDIGNSRLNFWDLGGQEELQSLWDKYYAESHAVIYVVDSSDRDRMQESVEAFGKMVSSETLDGVPLLLVINKQDLQDSMTVNEVKAIFHETWSKNTSRRACKVLGASALNGTGINEGIEWIVQSVEQNCLHRPPTQKDIS